MRNSAYPNPNDCPLDSRAHLKAELVLNGHDDLHMVQAVQPQVLDEVAAQRHLSPNHDGLVISNDKKEGRGAA